MKNNYILCFFVLFIFFTSCQDPSTIGGGILNEDNINIEKTEDFIINAKSVANEPFPFYTGSINENFIIGKYEDSQFGTTEASVYSNILRNTYTDGPAAPTDGATIDSIVLVLSYDSTYIYGPSDGSFDFTVYEMTENLSAFDTLWSNTIAESSSSILGQRTIPFAPSTKVSIISHETGEPVELDPQIRIPLNLDPSILSEANLESDATFFEVFKGIKIEANSVEDNAMMSLLFGIAADGSSGHNGIHVYYTDEADNKIDYRLIFSNRKFNFLKSGFEDSANGAALNSIEEGKQRLFLQALGGPEIEIEFSDLLSKMEGKAINSAILEVTVTDLNGENYTEYPPVNQLVGEYKSGKTLFPIRDIVIGGTTGLSIAGLFGGNLVAENGQISYKMNITNHILDILKGNNQNTLILSPYIRKGNPRRSLINGPESEIDPMRLSITFTEGR